MKLRHIALLLTVLATGIGLTAAPAAPLAPRGRPGDDAWQAIAAMERDAQEHIHYAPALAWLAARGPVRRPIPEEANVDALFSLTQAWAARGAQHLEQGTHPLGVADLSAVLQHGAAVERHAQTLAHRRAGVHIQDLSIQMLEVAQLDALSSSERDALLMVLGEADVVPTAHQSLQRQCAQDAEDIQQAQYDAGLRAWMMDAQQEVEDLMRQCHDGTPPTRAEEYQHLIQAIEANATRRAGLRDRLTS